MTKDKIYQIRRHQIRFFFKFKMHQNLFFLPGLRPDPAWGAYDAAPDPLLCLCYGLSVNKVMCIT